MFIEMEPRTKVDIFLEWKYSKKNRSVRAANNGTGEIRF